MLPAAGLDPVARARFPHVPVVTSIARGRSRHLIDAERGASPRSSHMPVTDAGGGESRREYTLRMSRRELGISGGSQPCTRSARLAVTASARLAATEQAALLDVFGDADHRRAFLIGELDDFEASRPLPERGSFIVEPISANRRAFGAPRAAS